MTKSDDPPGQYFRPPEPEAETASEGSKSGKELAQRYTLQTVKLAAATAFGDSDASVWTRLQAARLLAQIAGAIPEAIPGAPRPGGDGGDGGAHA